jgi:hypothetical protein
MPFHVRQQVDSMCAAKNASSFPDTVVLKVRGAFTGNTLRTICISANDPPKPQIEREIERMNLLYPNNNFILCHE